MTRNGESVGEGDHIILQLIAENRTALYGLASAKNDEAKRDIIADLQEADRVDITHAHGTYDLNNLGEE